MEKRTEILLNFTLPQNFGHFIYFVSELLNKLEKYLTKKYYLLFSGIFYDDCIEECLSLEFMLVYFDVCFCFVISI